MSATAAVPLLALFALGAIHGLNPAMGWLFAVALALQERRGRAVWRALAPLALGHGLAIAAAVGVVVLLGRAVPLTALRWGVALALLGAGAAQLRGHRHRGASGMQVGFRDLTRWSFLTATAHGAGLMVLPLVAAGPLPALADAALIAGHAGHQTGPAHGIGAPSDLLAALTFTAAHGVGYLACTAIVALVIYHRVGLRLLRTAWFNIDVLWALALVAAALITPFL